MRTFWNEYRRKRAIIAGIACIECQSLDTELVGKKRHGNRRCRSCGHTWKQGTRGAWAQLFGDDLG